MFYQENRLNKRLTNFGSVLSNQPPQNGTEQRITWHKRHALAYGLFQRHYNISQTAERRAVVCVPYHHVEYEQRSLYSDYTWVGMSGVRRSVRGFFSSQKPSTQALGPTSLLPN